MGVLVQNVDSGQFRFYLKGADSVMAPLLNKNEEFFVAEETELLSEEGLRTLVVASKRMSQALVQKFQQRMAQAEQSMDNREAKERDCVKMLERKLNLVAVTAVEDLLQESVRNCIDHLREAEIKGRG